MHVFAGVHITSITQFKFYPTTTEERALALAQNVGTLQDLSVRRGMFENFI